MYLRVMEFEFGQKIRKVRELKGYSQEYMAERLSISQKVYSNIENDKRRVDKDLLEDIAKVLEVNPNDLLAFDEKILFYGCTQSDWKMKCNFYGLADKERTLYDQRIEELKTVISDQKETITLLKSLLDNKVNS